MADRAAGLLASRRQRLADARPELAVTVRFGGNVEEYWDQNYHFISHKNYATVNAVPYDMYVSATIPRP